MLADLFADELEIISKKSLKTKTTEPSEENQS